MRKKTRATNIKIAIAGEFSLGEIICLGSYGVENTKCKQFTVSFSDSTFIKDGAYLLIHSQSKDYIT